MLSFAFPLFNGIKDLKRSDWFQFCIYAAIWLRICLFFALSPFNTDTNGHLEYVKYITEHRSLPGAGMGHETWQPPLYYVLAALTSVVSVSPKFIQAFSLITSIFTVVVTHRLVQSGTFLRSRAGKSLAMLIVCFLPQFVIYGLLVSNDSLAVFLAFLAFQKADEFQERPTGKQFIAIAFILCLGLLTKGYFLIISVLLFPCMIFHYWQNCAIGRRRAFAIYFMGVVILLCGCEKYFQNAIEYGRPFLSNLDFGPDWLKPLQHSYQGPRSLFDFNIFKLLDTPQIVCGVDEPTQHSIPLAMYGSFWYQYFKDSSFPTDSFWLLNIGRYFDLIGLGPTVLLLLGGVACCGRICSFLRNRDISSLGVNTFQICSIGTFIGAMGMMLHIYFKFDTWIVLMARLLFATLPGAFILCDFGACWIGSRCDVSKAVVVWEIAYLFGVFSFYAVGVVVQWNNLPCF